MLTADDHSEVKEEAIAKCNDCDTKYACSIDDGEVIIYLDTEV